MFNQDYKAYITFIIILYNNNGPIKFVISIQQDFERHFIINFSKHILIRFLLYYKIFYKLIILNIFT